MTTLIELMRAELEHLKEKEPLLNDKVTEELILLVEKMINKNQLPNLEDLSNLFSKIQLPKEE